MGIYYLQFSNIRKKNHKKNIHNDKKYFFGIPFFYRMSPSNGSPVPIFTFYTVMVYQLNMTTIMGKGVGRGGGYYEGGKYQIKKELK